MRKIYVFLLILLLPLLVRAEDITGTSSILVNNNKISKLTDKNENSYIKIDINNEIVISSEEDMYGLYIIYELTSKNGIIIYDDNTTQDIGKSGFLHEYIKLNKKANIIKIKYDEDVKIGEISVLSSGDIPDNVEVWDNPCDEADLLLLSTHSDDEQLFFAGLMPYYVSKGAKVQVVYFTNHNDNPKRLHEQLHGLYTVGIRNYPIIGIIPDAWSDNLNWAINNLKRANLSTDDALKFEVEMIRRFKPQVVVGHDENGEYSHGQHILNTYILKDAIKKANDDSYDLETKEKYGIWNISKVYLHLYKENQITMNYDEPLEYFNGKTAYEVSKEGYSKHLSQQYTWFTKWLTGVDSKGNGTPFTSATQIKKYSPLEFGLYHTTVGEDNDKNDMFENLILRKDQIKKVKNNDIKKDNNEKMESKSLEINKYILPLSIIIILIMILFIKHHKK